MPELMFVLKSLIIAFVVAICMQVKIGTYSIESHANHWIRTSSIPIYLEEVSAGAVLAIRNVVKKSSDFMGKTFNHESAVQKAGRLNFEFKRSPQYQSQQEQSNER